MKNESFHLWLEKNGAIQTIIKSVSLYNYTSTEKCQKAILQKLGEHPEKATLLYETDKRETEIKASLLYFPFLIIIIVYCFYILLAIPAVGPIPLFQAGLLQGIALIVAYRLTFFEEYLSSRKSLLLAKEKLMDFIQSRPTTPPTNKGVIAVILLQELIKKECKQPNLYQGDIKKNIEYYAYISNCNKKNMYDKINTYIKREHIVLESENAKTTHLRYLSMISDYYEETGDKELHVKAEELKIFISHLPTSK